MEKPIVSPDPPAAPPSSSPQAAVTPAWPCVDPAAIMANGTTSTRATCQGAGSHAASSGWHTACSKQGLNATNQNTPAKT